MTKLDNLLDLLLGKKTADTAWLVQVLHLVNANDAVFARDYVYVRPHKPKAQVSMPLVDNNDGFFDGLPMLSGKVKGKKGQQQQLRLTKAQREEMQLRLLEHRHLELTNKINALRHKASSAQASGAAQGSANFEQQHNSGSGSSSAEEGEAEQQEQNQSRDPNIIGNAEEVEAEQEELNGSGPNLASPYVRM